MNTVKSAIMLKEHYPEMEVKVFYIDIRAFGKGFEDLFRRSKGMGVRYIRGLPGSVRQDPASQDLDPHRGEHGDQRAGHPPGRDGDSSRRGSSRRRT